MTDANTCFDDLSPRVRRLVIAARAVAFGDEDANPKELDEAVEAFATDVAWEGQS